MEQRVAIVTGGLRGLGRAMTFGLAREGYHILAVGHIDADVATVEAEAGAIKPRGQIRDERQDLPGPPIASASLSLRSFKISIGYFRESITAEIWARTCLRPVPSRQLVRRRS